VTAGIVVRRGRPADAETLARLRYEFRAALDPARERPLAFVERCATWMRQQLESECPWYCWIAEHADETVGTIWLALIEKLPNPVAERERHAYITNLYVRPRDARGRCRYAAPAPSPDRMRCPRGGCRVTLADAQEPEPVPAARVRTPGRSAGAAAVAVTPARGHARAGARLRNASA